VNARIHETAVVSADAVLGDGVVIGAWCVVEAHTVLGDGTVLHPRVSIKSHTTLGKGNVVHEGAVLGGEPQHVGFKDAVSHLVIGDNNRIRENVTAQRSTVLGGTTRIGSHCFLMVNAHVAHDDTIGDSVVIANNVALAGHVEVGDRAFLGGICGVHQFCRIGRLAMVGGLAKIVQDCLPFTVTDGNPACARGLNTVGLRRAGVSAGSRQALKEAYRLLARTGLPLAEALARVAALGEPLAQEMGAFAAASRRGFHREQE
jgi:UDP-N-acetylglucosamine acyltransferase